MHFKEHGPRNNRNSGADGGIEALQVSDLADAAQSLRQADEFVGFSERYRQRLFNQHVDAGLHQLPGGIEMMDRGHRTRGSLDFAVRGGELLDRTKTAAAELARNRGSPRRIRVDNSDQTYGHAFVGQ